MSKRHLASATNLQTLKLVGHSGCKLEVEKRGEQYVVTKTAKDAAYSKRLEAQEQKQKAFTEKVFRAPAVLGSKTVGGLYSFSMEYVHGFTLAEHLKVADVGSIQPIAEKFLSFIPPAYHFDPDAQQIFAAKITDLEQKLDTRKDPVLHKAFERLTKHAWKHCIPSACHGDLSLENIIWKDGDLYLIDFLDSFYDSWMIDFAKLLFDVECLWSYRHEDTVDENLKVRLSIFKKMLVDELLAREHGRAIVREIYYMALLHIVRIMPYTSDDYTKEYLRSSVNKIQESIATL